ncbi:hypothetical protein COCON_G00055190 [Conger conger]|uniref:Uncharacterized protein n=1 Tax=Conger conger TaxID=82655 RepID=A0A9Q1DW94_CONCO|nr:hypothetical protein COCON_G00055190 [Conger conger]
MFCSILVCEMTCEVAQYAIFSRSSTSQPTALELQYTMHFELTRWSFYYARNLPLLARIGSGFIPSCEHHARLPGRRRQRIFIPGVGMGMFEGDRVPVALS